MPMNIIIQEKRREIGLTQEQIGQYLGVSTPAVNKWERGYTYPDISLLPALARLLKVDLNTLLCFNEELTEQEINSFINEVGIEISTKSFDDGFNKAIEKVREYPSCYKLIHSIALLLDGALIMCGERLYDKEVYEKQIIGLYERVAKSDNDNVRYDAIYMLASKYISAMAYEKAKEMLDLLPERQALDKTQLEASLFIKQDKLDEAAKLLERKLLNEVNEVQSILVKLAEIEVKEGHNKKATHLAELSQKVVELFEFGYMSAVALPLHIAILQKNVEKSISLLKEYFSATFNIWDVSESSLYHHIGAKVKEEREAKKEVIKDKKDSVGKQVRLALITQMENGAEYEFLRSNEEFQRFIEEMRNVSKGGKQDG